MNENYLQVTQTLGLTQDQVVQLAKNSFTASFLPPSQKSKFISEIDRYAAEAQPKEGVA